MGIREEAAAILGISIPKDQWEQTIKRLDVSGGINQRAILDLLIVVLKRLEIMENAKSDI